MHNFIPLVCHSWYHQYISIKTEFGMESMHPEHSASDNPISGGVVVQQCKL